MVIRILADFLLWYAVVIPVAVAIVLPLLTTKRAGFFGAAKIDATFLAWWYTYPPLILASAFAVPYMLACDWEGYTTLFGNYKYGIYGNKAMPCNTYLCAWWFLVVRNPLSNLGKQTLAVKSTASWPWFYDVQLLGPLWLKAGWKPVTDVVRNPERTFIFRPYFK